ncbi:MAG: 4Fe-4S dicluster domain-containing protein [Planctomycetes bacterium]|nr:4Fe-4S dicluster domain-containing protein [Planctomycetota bacterium]
MSNLESDRREFMRDGARAAARSIFAVWDAFAGGHAPEAQDQELPFLRPPGALPEPQFLEACTRCDDCVAACPHMAIRKAGGEFGDALRATPIILPRLAACRLCLHWRCIDVCRPQALRRPAERKDVRMGMARIEAKKCYAFQGQPCDYCVSKCPLKRDAIAFDENRRPVVNEDGCVGCGVCAELCPGEAIGIFAK